jgi:hypothetical protein
MTLQLITTIQRFAGLAADVATLPTSGITVGSKFTALDTGARYIFNGAAWVADLTDIAVTAQSLNPANDTVTAGYYAATTLHAVDADLATGNIRAGVTIFGISGKVEVVDTTEAVNGAVAADIALGKKAWVNGVEITGVHV